MGHLQLHPYQCTFHPYFSEDSCHTTVTEVGMKCSTLVWVQLQITHLVSLLFIAIIPRISICFYIHVQLATCSDTFYQPTIDPYSPLKFFRTLVISKAQAIIRIFGLVFIRAIFKYQFSDQLFVCSNFVGFFFGKNKCHRLHSNTFCYVFFSV